MSVPIAWHRPTPGDLKRTYELIVRCDTADYGEPDADLEDLQSTWSQIDLERDAWIAPAGESATDDSSAGDLIAYGAVSIHWQELQIDLYLHPSHRGIELATDLLARCEARGNEIAKEKGRTLVAKTYLAHSNHRLAEVVTETGFRLANVHYQMEVRLDAPLPPPRWPEGISVRTAVPGQDDREIYHLVETAFDRPGRRPISFKEWTDLMVNTDTYNPDLWFLAQSGDQLAGVCLGLTWPSLGWVRQLAVAEAWRRRGLGSALLHHAFAAFKGRGYERAGLAVEVKNEDARAFYQRVGMCPTRQHDEYAKRMPNRQGGR